MCNFNYCSVDLVVAKSHIYQQMLWGNLNIHIGNNPVFQDNFRCAGVIYISDVLDDNLELKLIEMFN